MSDFDPTDYDAAAQSIKALIEESQASADEATTTTMAKFEVDQDQLVEYFETIYHSSPEEYAETVNGDNAVAFAPEDFDIIDSDVDILIDADFDAGNFDDGGDDLHY